MLLRLHTAFRCAHKTYRDSLMRIRILLILKGVFVESERHESSPGSASLPDAGESSRLEGVPCIGSSSSGWAIHRENLLGNCHGRSGNFALPALGQAEAAFRRQFASSGERASAVFHPICVAWRVPIAIFSGFAMAKSFVLNSATNMPPKPVKTRTVSLFVGTYNLWPVSRTQKE